MAEAEEKPIPESKRSKAASCLPVLGCFTSSSSNAPRLDRGSGPSPTHLVVMVNGIIGTAGNWRFAAKQLVRRFPEDVIVHRSRCNYNSLTFDGVDVMGDRLAMEVLSVINTCPDVTKISFVAHSLGGLVARFVIARLYESKPGETSEVNGSYKCHDSANDSLADRSMEKIAGLEPINFITFVTPHLGSRWHGQTPFLCGFNALERFAVNTCKALGKTGSHLYLTDKDNGKPPLLLQMVSDNEDLKFMSALRSFKRRVIYSNMHSDYIVGRKTSSIRRQEELPKLKQFTKNCKYPHIVHVEIPKVVISEEKNLPIDKIEKEDMEEVMLERLNRLNWERVDVSFHGSIQRFMAHSTIQVKAPWMNSHGADVIYHMIDNMLV